MLSGDVLGELVVEIDAGYCALSRLISRKSVAEAVASVTKTAVHGHISESCQSLWRTTRPQQAGQINRNRRQGGY